MCKLKATLFVAILVGGGVSASGCGKMTAPRAIDPAPPAPACPPAPIDLQIAETLAGEGERWVCLNGDAATQIALYLTALERAAGCFR